MTLDNSGNVGIGTATPAQKLDASGTSGTWIQQRDTALASDTRGGVQAVGTATGGAQPAYARIFVFNNSNETHTCGALQLDSVDNADNFLWFDDADDLRHSQDINDVGEEAGTELHNLTSDERLKNIDGGTFPYGLTAVNNLSPIKYKWKEKPDGSDRLGFGAQTIQSIIPEVVTDTGSCLDGYDNFQKEDGTWDSTPRGEVEGNTKLVMSYYMLVPVLVKAIQELSAKVTALENA
jgi:hypothetical protein